MRNLRNLLRTSRARVSLICTTASAYMHVLGMATKKVPQVPQRHRKYLVRNDLTMRNLATQRFRRGSAGPARFRR